MGTKSISQLDPLPGSPDGTELVEASKKSEVVFITATTISADGDDNSYNDSANGFVAAGFEVGMRVGVTGFTGNVANNIVVGVVTVLTAGKMTIGGADGNVIVDDAAGESVTIAKWESYRTSLQSIADLASAGLVGLSVVSTDADDYTVDADDYNEYVRLTGAAAKTITVRDNAEHALPANGEWHFRNVGAGDATFVPDAGVTINAPIGGSLVVAQGGTVTLKRVAVDEFDLIGVTVAP